MNKRIDPVSKYIKENGSQFLTVEEQVTNMERKLE